MTDYLIIQLAGPLQSWGEPTFEGIRPSAAFPTRSGLLGLIGACLGIRREDKQRLQWLSDSVRFAVRCDRQTPEGVQIEVVKITDYHTVKDAREDYRGLKSHDTIQTWREYLCDAFFTVAIWVTPEAKMSLKEVVDHVQKPIFTPYLGRRSCPISRPLYVGEFRADDPKQALDQVGYADAEIYSEQAVGDSKMYQVRDEPMIHLPRQFASRHWYLLQGGKTCS